MNPTDLCTGAQLDCLHELIKCSPVQMALLDRNLCYIASSDRWNERYFEGGPCPVGQSHYTVVPNQPSSWRQYHQMALAGKASQIEFDIWKDRYGEIRHLNWSVVPWRSEGRVGGVVIVVDDASREVKAIREGDVLRGRLHLLLSAVKEAVYEWEIEEHRWYLSPRFMQMMGLPEDFPHSLSWWKVLTHPEDFDWVLRELEAALADPKRDGFAFEFRLKHLDSGYLMVATQGLIHRDEKGRPLRVVGTIRDLTAEQQLREEAHEARLHLSEAQKSADSRIKFLGVLSSEIRSPLNGMAGSLDLLADEKLDADKRDSLIRMQKASLAQVVRMLNDVVDYSKLELGHLAFHESAFDLNEVLNHLCDYWNLRCKEKGLAFERSVQLCGPTVYRGDPMRLRQVLEALLSNSLRYTSEGFVKVEVECSPKVNDRDEICFRVSDSGLGIPKEQIPKLFKPFERIEAGSGFESGGTGLGLAIVSNLVARMQGSVKVKSQPGKGSTFEVILTMRHVAPQRLKAGNEPPDEGHLPLRVLIADEDDLSRRMLSDVLAKRGMQTLCVSSGGQALDQMKSQKFDVLIVDYALCDMTAKGLLQKANALNLRENCLFVCLSGQCTPDFAANVYAAGFDFFLGKPLELKLLIGALQSHQKMLATRSAWPGVRSAAAPD